MTMGLSCRLGAESGCWADWRPGNNNGSDLRRVAIRQEESGFFVGYYPERRLERTQHLDHLGEYPRIRGDYLAAAQIPGFTRQVAHQATGFDDQKTSGGDIPGIQ